MKPGLTWQKGGTATVEAFDGEAITFLSSIPSPPGSRLEGNFEGKTVKFKIHQCKKQESGQFELRGRTVDFVREARDAIIVALHASNNHASNKP
jgi:hypothetical protein